MATDSPNVSEFTAHMTLSPQSVTVNDEGNADIFYQRTIINKETGETVVRDVVRVSDQLVTVQPLIDELARKAKPSNGE